MENDFILRTNELENSIDYLEKAAYYFNNREDGYWFKWLMISLHGSLYGFGVCATKSTDPINRVYNEPKSEDVPRLVKQTKKYYLKNFGIEIDEEFAERVFSYHQMNLLTMLAVIKRCQQEKFMNQNTESKVLKLTARQEQAIKKLNVYRNDFAHFKPRAVSVITEGEDWIVKEVLYVIKFLALESGNVFYPNKSDTNKLRRIIEQFKY